MMSGFDTRVVHERTIGGGIRQPGKFTTFNPPGLACQLTFLRHNTGFICNYSISTFLFAPKEDHMCGTARCFTYLLAALALAGPAIAQDTTQLAIKWLKENSLPIKYIDPGNDFSDLQPLKKTLRGIQVIGIGEATHGTHEFYQMTYRLVKFLVTEMGYTAFTLESSYSNCEPINDYILTGRGELPEVATGQGYMCWDTEEFAAMLNWLKDYNQKAPEEKKVHFYGIDVICYQGVGRRKVLAYLQKYVPDKVASTDSLFQILASEESKWPSRLDQDVLRQAFISLRELKQYFSTNKQGLISISSFKEWEQSIRYLEMMEEGIFHVVNDLPSSLSSGKLARDDYMAQNMLYLLQTERQNTKFILWAHNDHISIDTVNYFPGGKTVGFHLRQWFGDKYYALGLLCNEGTFTARVLLPDGYWGELKADTIMSFQKSVTWHLEQTRKGNLFIDLRMASSNPVLDKWLDTPGKVGNGSWLYKGASENSKTQRIKGLLDGIIFIGHSTPSHPTRNAVASSAAKIGF